tara:strand:- start:1455 stop:2261 length:807 start_codon:yes stop_codon:yes gene_type:complete
MLDKNLSKTNLKDLSLVILSSEDYEYLWSNFTHLWNKYCNELKIRKYLISTKKNGIINKFKIIRSNFNKEDIWSKRILSSVKKINSENLLVLTDDLFISEKINIKEFIKTYMFFKKNKILHLRLCPSYRLPFKKKIFFLNYYSFHRISLQPSLWNKKYLLQMLSNKETPRQFEIYGSIRTKIKDKIYYSNYYIIKYIEIIRKGKVTPEGLSLLKKEFKKLKKGYNKMDIFELLNHYYKKYKGFLFYLMPESFRSYYVKKRIKFFKSNL